MPVLGEWTGVAVGCGINPRYADIDPWAMAACAIDEAVRNVIAVGADPARVAILDNFCWGDAKRPESLGSLVRAAEACRDVAVAYRTPFISGKDSLNNEFRSEGRHIAIPPTLLISALGRVADVRRCVTMDLKEPGNEIWLVGSTRDELGGSHLHLVRGETGGAVPTPDLGLAPRIFRAVHQAILKGLVRSCHDLSEGGLAVALAEMAFAGGVGVEVPDLSLLPGAEGLSDEARLFSESPTRFLLEVRSGHAAELRACLDGVPAARIGFTATGDRVQLGESIDAGLAELKEAWQRPLRW
jgi:phosphoribosylformylglycinamidine synthase